MNELDRISELPDPLICQILYHLSTRAAVRTSVLSTRWRTLWLWVPSLDLIYRDDLDALVNFGDRFFHSHRVSCIDKVELLVPSYKKHEGGDDPSYVTPWIDAAVKRKIQHLAVVNFPAGSCSSNHDGWVKCYLHQMPLSLYICETLVSLRLLEVQLPDSEFISLPCLKILHLSILWNPSEATFERLVSSSPVLEELNVCGFWNENVQVFRVISKSLKDLTIATLFTGSKVVIDAPRLGFLSIDSSLSECYVITNMDSTNVELVIHLGNNFEDYDEASLLPNSDRFSSFLSGISKVRDITILGNSFKGYSWCKWLPPILESCPNLKSLSLECCYAEHPEAVLPLEDVDEIKFSHVPQCLLSSLEFVDLHHVPLSRVVGEMLVRYIIDNSAILKKLTLHLHKDCSTEDELVKKLLKIPRGSAKCEVVFVDWIA
ncbi:putative FBD-associated F-box protein At5g53635 [Raphanus sativus]|uniref:FBD-associated F-box protein At5g53635 n=1 Tax=Raphanus sativus TaxID=3726 RepID=A0A6J0MRK6_RAPSA|nr:putative FBD-associated F-box protein At5g53635 [Raphanus sativus]